MIEAVEQKITFALKSSKNCGVRSTPKSSRNYDIISYKTTKSKENLKNPYYDDISKI